MKAPRAFTLIEVLVAMAVLGLLIVLSANIVSQTLQTSEVAQRRLSAMEGGRQVLDAVGNDLSQMAIGHGAVVAAPDGTRNALAFLTSGRPLSSSGDVADVRFVSIFLGMENRAPVDLGSSASIPMVARGIGRSLWSTQPGELENAVSRVASRDVEMWQPLWEGAFRMEVVFLTKEGRITPNPPLSPAFGSSLPLPHTWQPLDPDRLRGIVVAVALLDKETLRFALSIDHGIPARLAGSLPGITVENRTPLQVWSIDDLPSDIPNRVRQNVRFFERTFYISGTAQP